MTYELRDGSKTYCGIKAQTIGTQLEKIRRKNDGRLETKAVVNEARSENSPLHGAFTWDDTKAAELHRNWEARQLIKVIIAVNEDTDEREPAFAHVRTERPDGYYKPISVMTVEEAEAMLHEAATKMASAQATFSKYKDMVQKDPESGEKLGKISIILEALATARTMAERIM